MCVDAGLNFSGAVKQAVDKGPHGALRNEFRVILRDINSGYTRADALTRMEERVNLQDISVFVRAVIQADRLGSSLKDTLSGQASQRLNERFQRAEKAAMEAPVKLIVPLVIFIFPLTFIILLFPIVMEFQAGGSL
jgi:tight adherence protein C